tara:strand:- start:52 stop:1161 length:1110 start_codon:yes stop_codon:yes gene_type:complete
MNKFEKINLLELFHGPTLSFKDIALQVIGNMYESILEKNKSKINIVVATSGDTGAAAINAIKGRKNMKIFVLHPDNKISEVQRKFMTTVDSKNIFNIALDGNFDDCQKFVKSMFADKKFSTSINISGVNSINWSRIVVQIVYYFFSYFKIAKEGKKINFSVPTGNFGDIYAGFVAKKMGLPINKLIIATNNNDILKRVVRTGVYKPLKVEHTISPSMDIQVASNFERLVFDICNSNSDQTLKLMNELNETGQFILQKENLNKIYESFCSESLSEEETKSIISNIHNKEQTIIDPHTAVGIGAAYKIALEGDTVVLSTAHPSKFSNIIMQEIGKNPILPESVKKILDQKEKYTKLPKDLKKIKNYILERV